MITATFVPSVLSNNSKDTSQNLNEEQGMSYYNHILTRFPLSYLFPVVGVIYSVRPEYVKRTCGEVFSSRTIYIFIYFRHLIFLSNNNMPYFNGL